MKPVLLLFLSASLCAAQSNAVNGKGGGVTDAAAFRTALSLASATGIHSTNGPVVAVNSGASTLSWAGVMAQMSVEASAAKHALIARSPSGAANGIAVVGWSSSGAAAAKFYQDTDYTSATLYAIRAATNVTTPVVEISSVNGTATHPALTILPPASSTPSLTVAHNGNVTTSGSITASGGPNVIGGVSLASGTLLANSVQATSGNISASGTVSGSNLSSSVVIKYTNAAPNNALVGNPGDLCIQVTAGTATLHVKQTGTGTNTGWVAK